jgi:hypothetical protein
MAFIYPFSPQTIRSMINVSINPGLNENLGHKVLVSVQIRPLVPVRATKTKGHKPMFPLMPIPA